MPWVKIDDHFDEHPKLAAVGPLGWGVWLAGLAYCNRNLTDGFIPWSIAEGIGGAWLVRMPYPPDTDDRSALREGLDQLWHIGRTSGMDGDDMDAQWVAELLVTYGLWDEVAGGYQVHDYADFQPTKAEILADRAAKAAAGKAGGIAAAIARATAGGKAPRVAQSKPVPVPDPVPPSSSIEDSGDARAKGKAPEDEKPFVMLNDEEKAAALQAERDEMIAKAMRQVGLRPELVK